MLLICCSAFSVTAQTDLPALLSERASRIASATSTKDIDLRIYELGERTTAVIHYETLENGNLQLIFPIFLPVNDDRASRVIQRLTATYPYLLSMSFDLANDKVTCLLEAGTTESQMEEITNHFGYIGHETAN